MTTQSVMSQAANLLGNSPGSVTLKGKQTGSDFSILFSNNLKSAQDPADHADVKANQKTSSEAVNSHSTNRSDDTEDDSSQVAVKTNTSQNKTEDVSDQKIQADQSDHSKVTLKEETDSKQNEELTADEQLMARIEAMLQAVQQIIMEKLNLTQEELNQLLEGQGLNVEDLLQSENFQQLVLVNSGTTDITSLLTDENLADVMKQLLQAVEGIQKESNIGLTADQIKALLEQAQVQNSSKDAAETVGPTDSLELTQKTSEQVNQTQSKGETEKSQENTSWKNAVGDENQTKATATTDDKSDASSNFGRGNQGDKDQIMSDRFQTFVDNLVKSSQNVQTNVNEVLTQVTNLREIANQIIERIKVSVTADHTSMELQLNPENLGKVNLSVQSKNGVLTAQFVVQNELSKEAIESQIQTLRDTLHQQGVKVEAIEVTVSANAFEQNYNPGSGSGEEAEESKSGRNITLEDALNMTEDDEALSSNDDVSGISGNVINYKA